jgi:SAM-dependent methyltransferase
MVDAPSTPTPYDLIPYPSRVQLRLHPERTRTVARLLGVELADVGKCRVLELGCGDGLNLASMALAYPESQFVGIDLASRPIATGRELIGEVGLRNVELLEADLMGLPVDLGTFDYIIAHGVYSWVPPPVRDALLAACKRFLEPSGVAYVSYAVYPGCHLRELVRDMMLIHTDRIEDPIQKVNEGRSFVAFIKENQASGTGYGALLESELERLHMVSAEYLVHDDFSMENSPVYFGAFIQHARCHGLDFFAESQFSAFEDPKFPPELKRALSVLSAGDIATEEQYVDFLRCRAFRQTLLCHDGTIVDRTPDLERVFSLHASADLVALSEELELFEEGSATFRTPKGTELATARPLLKLAFSILREAWPMALPVRKLWDETNAALAKHGVPSASDDREVFARTLVQAAGGGFVELAVNPPKFCLRPGERPTASPLARAQARRGPEVTSLRHAHHRITDDSALYLLTLLDGTRTRPELLAETEQWLDRVVTTGPKPELTLAAVDATLEKMARQGLLLA